MEGKAKGRHEWIIEFHQVPKDVESFAKDLDTHLQDLNSDYEAKRYKNMTLAPLSLHVARKNLFYDWLKEKGKVGGQHKVPRLSNTREFVDQLLEMNA
jgi:hypothetical protein